MNGRMNLNRIHQLAGDAIEDKFADVSLIAGDTPFEAVGQVSEPSVIEQLPHDVVDKIRAGEVIDKPAAVINELVANSLDAGATKIDIYVSADARTIIVTDDGSGMFPRDMSRSLLKHATSKYKEGSVVGFSDTFGFRGEALNAIALMAESVNIVSRKKGNDAYQIEAEHDFDVLMLEASEPKPASFPYPSGTSITVNNLFETHRPRLAHLKKPIYEFSLIKKFIRSWSLFTDASFSVSRENGESFPIQGDRRDRIASMAGENAILSDVDYISDDGISISGHLLSSNHRVFAVNGRPVDGSVFMKSALQTAGHEGGYVISVQVPYSDVDVNVHPSKERVTCSRDLSSHLLKAVASGEIASADVIKKAMQESKKRTRVVKPKRETKILDFIDNRYAVASSNGEVVLCDIHAAHERMIMEENNTSSYSMFVRIPDKIEAPEKISDIIAKLENMGWGFFIDENSVFIIKSPYPEDKAGSIFEKLLSGQKTLQNASCRVAWRYGQERDDDVFAEIIEHAIADESGSFCNHGRPTVISLSKETLDKIFHRN